MARRSRSRDLAGLAALGALAYNFLGPGSRRKDGTLAPVSDATPVPVERILRGSTAAEPRLQETFMGLDDVSGPQAETGGMGRSTGTSAADQGAMPPPVSNAQAAAAPIRAASTPARAVAPTPVLSDEAMRGRGTNRAPVPTVVGPRSTGRGGATAAEMAAYQREQELERMRGRGYGTTYKKGGAVKAKKMASGGMTSASKRADGIATKGKTKCKMY